MGIITKLSASTRKKELVNIFIDDSFFVQVHVDVVMRYGLQKSLEVSEELKEKLMGDKRIIFVKQSALRFVCYKPRTEYQVRNKLKEKEFTESEINLAVSFLYEFAYLNDEDYCRMYINDYLLRAKTSSRKLFMDLKKRGVNDSIVYDAINKYYPENDKEQIALEAGNKKLRSVTYKPIDKQKKSVIDYLLRQGFEWSLVKTVTSKIFDV